MDFTAIFSDLPDVLINAAIVLGIVIWLAWQLTQRQRRAESRRLFHL